MSVEENKRLMKTLDNAWNSQDWDTFNKRHAKEVAVYWPGQPEPTRGQHAHQEEAEQFLKTFPDNHVGNDPYLVLFGEDDWTCSVANFTGTMKGPTSGPDGKMIPPTNKRFQVEFCTVARWNDKGKIVQEKLFYDLVGLMRQIGLM
ncbi:MAG: ester cyclase [Halobacteriota archaeon]